MEGKLKFHVPFAFVMMNANNSQMRYFSIMCKSDFPFHYLIFIWLRLPWWCWWHCYNKFLGMMSRFGKYFVIVEIIFSKLLHLLLKWFDILDHVIIWYVYEIPTYQHICKFHTYWCEMNIIWMESKGFVQIMQGTTNVFFVL